MIQGLMWNFFFLLCLGWSKSFELLVNKNASNEKQLTLVYLLDSLSLYIPLFLKAFVKFLTVLKL